MITVADVMKLPSMYGATILAGHAGISNPVESVTVLEYGQITSTLDELFSQTEFQGNALILRMLSNHLQASIILTDYKKSISNIACWPQSLSELLSKELKKTTAKNAG